MARALNYTQERIVSFDFCETEAFSSNYLAYHIAM